MSSSTLTCPSCRQPLSVNAEGLPTCSACTVSFQLIPASLVATLSLPGTADPQATVGEAAIATYQPPASGQPRDERAPPGYEILGELGRGGMGVVYRAKHLRLGRLCALKMILAGGHAGEQERRRFENEAQAIARLQHPGIVQVFEVGEHQGHPFMALELCEGGSLDARLRDQPPTAQQAAALVRDLAVAMQAAHEARVIHRDLKPGNVLITADGTLKVTDFGLAKKLDAGEGQTRTGAIMGTPSYMPPEQAEGRKDLGPAADVYALGAILYAALTGRPPFRGATPMETVMQVLDKEPVPVQELNPSVPRDLATIAHKCLQKEPGKRYASARALADDLERFLKGEPIHARPVGRLERAVKWVRRNPIVSALTTAVILVLTAGIVVSWLYADEAARQAKEATEYAKQAGEEADRATREEANALDRLRQSEWSVYAGKLLLAQAAFNEKQTGLNLGMVPDAIRHLEECQWDLRGWEHAHLRWRFDSSKQTLKAHTSVVYSVSWSPDGKRILTGSWDGTAKVWDAETGAELLTFKGHTKYVTSVCFSSDGKRILTGSYDKTAKVWDAEKGQEVLSLRGHTSGVTSVAWSPDGKRILTGSEDRTVKIWDAGEGKQILELKGHVGIVRNARFSPDGKRILTGSYDKTAKVWDAEKGQEVLSLKGHTGTVYSVAFSPDGKRILTGSEDNLARVWDSENRIEGLTLRGHSGPVYSVAWAPDGKRILTGSVAYENRKPLPGEAKLWDPEKGTEALTLKGHTAGVFCVCFSPESKRILTGSEDRTAKLWDAKAGTEALTLKGHTAGVTSVCFSPDGEHIITGSWDKTAKLWDAKTGTESLTLKGHTAGVTSVCFSPDGKHILTGSGGLGKSGEAKLWNAEKGTEVLTLKGHTESVSSVCFSPDGKRILTGSWDQTAKMWEADKGTEIFTFKGHGNGLTSVCFSPDGKRILTGSMDRTAKVWEAESGTELFTLHGYKATIHSVCFSSNGKRILVGGFDNTAKVWETDNKPDILKLVGGHRSFQSVTFSSDSKRMFAWNDFGEVLAWSVKSGKPIPADNPPPKPNPGPAVSPDGRLRAKIYRNTITLTDLLIQPVGDPWPLPDASERKAYHTEQADVAEKAGQWYAATFHVGRLLLDDPDNAELKKRREEALKKHEMAAR